MNILDLKRKAMGWNYRCGGGSTNESGSGSTTTDTSTTDTDYSNEGRNHTPSGTTAGGTQDAGGGWSADTTTTPDTTTPDTGLGSVPELSTPDYSLGGAGSNVGVSIGTNTSLNPGAALGSNQGANTLGGNLSPNTSSDPAASLTTNDRFTESGSAGLSVGGTYAPKTSFIDPNTSVYSTSVGRTTFGQLSPAEQEMQARNILDGRPGYYNNTEPGFREKFVDAMNFGLDKTGLIGRAAKDLGVVPGMSFDEQRQFEENTPGAAQTRFDRMNDIASAASNIAISMAPGAGLLKTGINMARNIEAGVPFDKALQLAVTDSLKGYAAGAINKEFSKAIGPDAAGMLGSYNKAASVANMLGAGVPGINVGATVVNNTFGPPSGPARTNSGGGAQLDSTGAQVYGGVGAGWTSSGGSGGSGVDSKPATQPEQPAVQSVPSAIPTATRFKDAKGFGKAFTEGVRSRYRR